MFNIGKVSGNALCESIKSILEDGELTDRHKLIKVKIAINLYKSMNKPSEHDNIKPPKDNRPKGFFKNG